MQLTRWALRRLLDVSWMKPIPKSGTHQFEIQSLSRQLLVFSIQLTGYRTSFPVGCPSMNGQRRWKWSEYNPCSSRGRWLIDHTDECRAWWYREGSQWRSFSRCVSYRPSRLDWKPCQQTAFIVTIHPDWPNGHPFKIRANCRNVSLKVFSS